MLAEGQVDIDTIIDIARKQGRRALRNGARHYGFSQKLKIGRSAQTKNCSVALAGIAYYVRRLGDGMESKPVTPKQKFN
jgi:hypothetical protein